MAANICQTCLSSDRLLFPIDKLKSTLDSVNIFIKSDGYNGGICWECKAVIVKFSKFKIQAERAQKILYNNIQIINTLSILSSNLKVSYDYTYIHKDSKCTNVKVEFESFKHEENYIHCSNEINIEELKVSNRLDKPIKEENDKQFNSDTDDKYLEESMENIDNISIKNNIINQIVLRNSVINNRKDDEILKKYIDLNETKMIAQTHLHRNNIDKYIKPNQNKTAVKNQSKAKTKDVQSLSKRSKIEEELKEKFNIIVFSEEEMIDHREKKRCTRSYKKCQFKCDSCVLGFIREDTFRAHISNSHNESSGQYSCDICQVRFPTNQLLSSHIQQHYINYKCVLCKFETSIRKVALTHCRKHWGDTLGSIHCPQCEETVATPEELVEHRRKRHTVACTECGEVFRGKDTLRAHKKRIHNARRQYICDVCHKTFMKKTRLESHVATHDDSLALRLAYCSQCDVQYKSLAIYRNHLRNSLHHSERIYKCQDCGKKFASKVYLKKHRDFYHLRKSSFKCVLCDKIFISDYQLRVHNQTRHGQTRPRNYPCDVCERRFYTPATLRGHQLTHSEQRSYMCEDCGDTFKQRPALYTHCRLVHKGRRRNKTINIVI